MLLIGLTGGIASGKTLVSDRFASLGVPVVDADVIAREVVRPGSEGLAAIADVFGADILNDQGELDRPALRRIVFADDRARGRLEALTHPRIRSASIERLAECERDGASYAINAIPLLVETGQTSRFDRVLVVDVPTSVQLERLLARDAVDEASAQRMLDAQATREQRLAAADDVILNTGTAEDAWRRVDALHEQYLKLAVRPR